MVSLISKYPTLNYHIISSEPSQHKVDDWESTRHFNKDWFLLMQRYQPFMPEGTIKKNMTWFEYVFNQDNPAFSTFRCRLCYLNYDAFNLKKNYRPLLADEKPVIVEIKDQNTRYLQNRINFHGQQRSHKEVIKKLAEAQNGEIPEPSNFGLRQEIGSKDKDYSEDFLNANGDFDKKNDEIFDQPMAESLDDMKKENPWDISSIFDLSYFHCPECQFMSQSKQDFIIHASREHPWVRISLKLCKYDFKNPPKLEHS